jgi:hypothetical protein
MANNLFQYHANGHVLSGRFDRPKKHAIEVQAGTTLPACGGHGNSRVENFQLDDILSFKAGYSHVSGSEMVRDNKVIHTTQVTSVVEGLNILDMVTADRIVARLASSYEHGNKKNGNESKILVFGSRFENLRIAGKKVEVELQDELAMKLDTFAAARNEFATNEAFRRMTEDFFAAGKLPKKVEIHEVVRCSLVKELSPGNLPPIKRSGNCGHILTIPEFGKMHLAELSIEHGRKRLTMLRVMLGSPTEGDLTVVEADSNGRPPT